MFIEERFDAIIVSLSLSKDKTHLRLAAEGKVIVADIPNVGNDPFLLNECSRRDGTTLVKSYPEEVARKEWLRALLLLWSLQGLASLKFFGRFSAWKQLDLKSIFNLTYAEKANDLFTIVEEHPEEIQPFVFDLILRYRHLFESVLTKELIRREKRYDDDYSFFDVVRLEGIYLSFNNKAAAVVELSSSISGNASRSESPVPLSASRPARSTSPTKSRPSSVGKTRFVGLDDLVSSQKAVREASFASNAQLSELKERIASLEQFSDLKGKVASLEHISDLKGKVASIEQFSELQAKITSLERSLKQEVVGKSLFDTEISRTSNVEKRLLSLIERQSELQKQVEVLSGSLKKTGSEQKEQLDKKLISISDFHSGLQTQIRAVSTETKGSVNSLQSEIDIVRSEGRSLQSLVKSLETRFLEIERSFHEAGLKQQQFQTSIESRFASLEANIGKMLLSHQQTSYESRIASIETVLAKTDPAKKLQVLEGDIEKLSKSILEIEMQQKKALLVKR